MDSHSLEKFVHVPLDTQAGLSGFGALLQIARLNCFVGQDFLSAFGLRFRYREDLSRLLTFSLKQRSALASALGLSYSIASSWKPDQWEPFIGDQPWAQLPWRLRACLTCLRHGYHSTLFQMPWVDHCPWHRELLTERCRKCGQLLLTNFGPKQPLLVCACGHDPVNEVAVLKGESVQISRVRAGYVEGYLDWARMGRENGNRLLCPEEVDPFGPEALHGLMQAPEPLRRRAVSTEVHFTARCAQPTARMTSAEHAATVASAHCLWPDTPGIAALPKHFAEGLVQVTRNISTRIPDDTLSALERKALSLHEVREPSLRSSRLELLFLPVLQSRERAQLDTGVLHRTSRRAVANLAWEWLSNDPNRRYEHNGSHRLLLRAVQQTLARGYADGLKHVLGRLVPAIFDHPRIRSGPRIPWVLIVKQHGMTISVRTAWTRRRPWESGT